MNGPTDLTYRLVSLHVFRIFSKWDNLVIYRRVSQLQSSLSVACHCSVRSANVALLQYRGRLRPGRHAFTTWTQPNSNGYHGAIQKTDDSLTLKPVEPTTAAAYKKTLYEWNQYAHFRRSFERKKKENTLTLARFR